jgi:aminodeoxyfutalosine deaminase
VVVVVNEPGTRAMVVPSDADLRALPKVELHVHLGGTIEPGTVAELARRRGVDLQTVLPNGYPNRYQGFAAFLAWWFPVNGLVQTPEDVELIAAAFARRQVEHRVRYTETLVTVGTFLKSGMEPRAMWRALRRGLESGLPDAEIRVVVDVIRDEGPDAARAVVRLVADADAPIVGLGLTGVEGAIEESEFTFLRSESDRLGMGLAVHAGEMGTPENVRAALDVLGADRIGHGIASVRDQELVARLAREQVPLEVCPTSNVLVGLAPSLERHPIIDLWRAGVNVTVHSDDPAMFRTSITDELANAVRLLDLDTPGLAELERRAARAAFAPVDVRERLVAEIDDWGADRPS